MSIFEYNEEETLKAIKEDEYELGVQDGIKRGETRGKIEGKAETLLLILESKGEVTEDLHVRITSENDSEKLDEWVRQALTCVDLEEFVSGLK